MAHLDGTHMSNLAPRGPAEVLTPNPTQRTTLIVAACYVVAIGLLVSPRISPQNPYVDVVVALFVKVPILGKLIYPFKLLVVGLHELSHALAGILTCGSVESIQLDPDEGGTTRMRGGVPAITLPAGYLGSSFIGACLIACGFDTSASKVACLVLAFFWILTLWWARKSVVAWLTILFMAALIVVCWLFGDSVALRFLILFIGVMSCFYSIWDIIDDTIARKVNTSDASEFAVMIGCCGPRVWGLFWLMISAVFFVAGILVGIAVFKDDWAKQAADADNFLGGSPFRR